jgi:hypothetical protein
MHLKVHTYQKQPLYRSPVRRRELQGWGRLTGGCDGIFLRDFLPLFELHFSRMGLGHLLDGMAGVLRRLARRCKGLIGGLKRLVLCDPARIRAARRLSPQRSG